MSEQKVPSFKDLLFVPHVFGKTDCWWCVREVFKRYGIHIPEYNAARAAVKAVNYDLGYFGEVVEENLKYGRWEYIEEPEAPCLVTISITIPVYHHVGVYIGYGKFIHNSSFRGKTTRERLDNPIYAKRRFYRYHSNNSN